MNYEEQLQRRIQQARDEAEEKVRQAEEEVRVMRLLPEEAGIPDHVYVHKSLYGIGPWVTYGGSLRRKSADEALNILNIYDKTYHLLGVRPTRTGGFVALHPCNYPMPEDGVAKFTPGDFAVLARVNEFGVELETHWALPNVSIKAIVKVDIPPGEFVRYVPVTWDGRPWRSDGEPTRYQTELVPNRGDASFKYAPDDKGRSFCVVLWRTIASLSASMDERKRNV